MESILFLVHRVPFPPNTGDKIRSYHWLRHLATRYDVHLGTFVDNRADAYSVRALDEWCASHCAVPLHARAATLRSVTAFLTGEPLTLPYYRSTRLQRWVEMTVAKNRIREAVVFSSAMAQYVERLPDLRVVLDLVDVDSAKWAQYAQQRSWPLSSVYRREGAKLLAFERGAAARAAATVLVTRAEADLFVRLAPESEDRVHVVESGVDTEYFTPNEDHPSPYTAGEAPIVFTGAMDYWPNVDAVTWFAREVLPQVVLQRSDARFYIVGMNPSTRVTALASDARVCVTGKVRDVRPYVQHAAAVVAPLRIARGIQNKILEAMSMAKPVVASAEAAGGVRAVSGVDFETAGSGDEFCRKVLAVMCPEVATAMGKRARARVVADYGWAQNQSLFDKLLRRQSADAARPAPRFVDASTGARGTVPSS